MTFAVEVVVALKPVVNDPQGLVVRDGLHRLGFSGVRAVRVGNTWSSRSTAMTRRPCERRLRHMCEQLLRNTVIEDSRIGSIRVLSDRPS